MRHWNYRVIKRVHETEEAFGIHECYYDSAGLIHSVTENPCPVVAESMAELRDLLDRMKRALNSPVLDFDKLPEPGALSEEPDVVELWDLDKSEDDPEEDD